MESEAGATVASAISIAVTDHDMARLAKPGDVIALSIQRWPIRRPQEGADNGTVTTIKKEHAMKITVETLARTDLETVWSAYNTPDDITQWNSPSADWHSPRSQVDLRAGGTFNTRMEARDGSVGFDFEGTYTKVVPQRLIEYRMGDGREVAVHFDQSEDGVRVRTIFDAETENAPEVQQQGWQAILDNFGRYAETRVSAR